METRLSRRGFVIALAAIVPGVTSAKRSSTDKQLRRAVNARLRGYDALEREHGTCTVLIQWPDDLSAVVLCGSDAYSFDPDTRRWTPWRGCYDVGTPNAPKRERITDLERCYGASPAYLNRAHLQNWREYQHWRKSN